MKNLRGVLIFSTAVKCQSAIRSIAGSMLLVSQVMLLVATALTLFTPNLLVAQTTRYVAPDGQGSDSGNCSGSAAKCATIQYAIDQASEGDVIQLDNGLYTEKIVITKNLTIRGDGILKTGIQAATEAGVSDVGRVVQIESDLDDVVLEDLTIRYGAGAYDGCGVNIGRRSSVFMRWVLIFENLCPARPGGGIHIQQNSDLALEHVTIANNTASRGGGIFVSPLSNLTMDNTSLINNKVTVLNGDGGAIYAGTGNVTIRNSLINLNETTRFGGAYYSATSDNILLIENSEISHNTAGADGGAIRMGSGYLTIDQTEIHNNRTTGAASSSNPQSMGGGAIYIWGLGNRILITNSEIRDNESANHGGGIYLYQGGSVHQQESQARILNTKITGNKAALNGGGAAVTLRASMLIGEGSLVSGNTAGQGGGGIWTDNRLDVRESTISNNEADNGGAIRLMNTSNAVISHSRITGNKARGFAGIFATFSHMHISNSLFSGNRTDESGASAFINHEGRATVKNTTIASNFGTLAPVIHLGQEAETTMTNVLIWGNRSASGTEQVRQVDGGTMTLTHSLVEGWGNPEYIYVHPGSVLTDGGGNYTGNPDFAAPLAASQAPTDGGVYRIMPDGLALNAGTNEGVDSPYDILGNARISGGTVDIGAYEYVDDASYTEFEIPENNIEYRFRDWLIGLRFTGIRIDTPVYLFVEEHEDEPEEPEYANPSPIKISKQRWVITTAGGEFEKADVTFASASTLIEGADPDKLIIYKRSKKGIGVFEPLQTVYIGLEDVVRASVGSFSEFVVGAPEGAITSIREPIDGIPQAVFLDQNYPNPFNPATEIRFGLPGSDHVRLQVFDLAGRLVALVAEGYYAPGIHHVRFDASALASGLYLYRLQAGDQQMTRKFMIVK